MPMAEAGGNSAEAVKDLFNITTAVDDIKFSKFSQFVNEKKIGADKIDEIANANTETKRIELIEKYVDEVVSGAGNIILKRTNWINNLKTEFDVNALFSPQGLDPNSINTTLKNQIMNGFNQDLPYGLKEDLFNKIIKSGKDVPVKKTLNQGEELYKIVPKGNGYSQSSFYMNKTEFEALKNSVDIEQKLGLPLGSHAVEYDVYKATANQSIDVFESPVANTVQGVYTTTGGARQTFLLDDSKWTITLEPNSLIPPK